jgi:hypothetical protein
MIALVAATALVWSQQERLPVSDQVSVAASKSARITPAGGQVLQDTANAEAPEPAKGFFQDGFCSPAGEDPSVTLHFTLPGELHKELERRLAGLPEDQNQALLSSLDLFVHGRNAPGEAPASLVLIALSQRDIPAPRLLALADATASREPDDPWVQVVRAAAADDLGQTKLELDALRRARRGLPRDPAVGWKVAQIQRDTPEVEEAIAGLDAYLAAEPTPRLSRLRARLIVQRDIQHDYLRRARDGVTVLYPPGLLSDAQLDEALGAIADALSGVARLIGFPRRPALTAVIYPGPSEMFAVTCVPHWAQAVYDGTLRLVAVPDQPAGVPLLELRHEATHAQLTPVLPDAPQWLQEGLAQYFSEPEPEPKPRRAWQDMLRNRTWIPFESMDGTFFVFDKSRDADLAYGESLALVAFMQARGGNGAVAKAVRLFKAGAKTSAVLAAVTGQSRVTGEDLLAFLAERAESSANR